MGIREIPKSFEYICDVCQTTHVQQNANGHYTDSRPPSWGRLTLSCDALDWQGAPVADGTTKLLLCEKCLRSAAALVDKLRSGAAP